MELSPLGQKLKGKILCKQTHTSMSVLVKISVIAKADTDHLSGGLMVISSVLFAVSVHHLTTLLDPLNSKTCFSQAVLPLLDT